MPIREIADARNDCNLNLPRYIDSGEAEDLHDIDGHLRGGIPQRDLDALARFWQVLPGVRGALIIPADRPGYFRLSKPITEVKAEIKSVMASSPRSAAPPWIDSPPGAMR